MGTRKSVPSSSETSYTTKIASEKQTDVHSQGKSYRRATTIGILLDGVLLDIFDFCRMMHYDYPSSDCPPHPVWDWHILVHVCRRWRQIIFESPRRLDLRILCTYRTPVRKNLDIWPALPIVLELFSPESLNPQDENNVITALEHRDRVCSVRFETIGSQLAKLAAVMKEPFPVLTHLYMRSRDLNTPVFTAEFLGGSAPQLQEITLFRIPFPAALPTLLSSTSDLVTLNLFRIPTPGYISPEQMIASLAALPRLKTFAMRFRTFHSHPERIFPRPVTRPVLPALTIFSFMGASGYLEDLVTQIDSPKLKQISINYLDLPDDIQVTQLSEFIDRSIGPELIPSGRAHVRFHHDTFSLSREDLHASYQGGDRRTVATTVSMEAFDYDMTEVARVLGRFSAALCTVLHLELEAQLNEGDQSNRAYDVEWLHLLRKFPAMEALYVSLEPAAPFYHSLEVIIPELVAEVFPSLGLICLEGVPASSLEKIVAICQFSDHPITVVETIDEFNKRLESYVSR